MIAIHTSKNIFTSESKGFWLDIDKSLSIDEVSLEEMNGKIVTIKGKIDTVSKGHFTSYLATISKIYYLKE